MAGVTWSRAQSKQSGAKPQIIRLRIHGDGHLRGGRVTVRRFKVDYHSEVIQGLDSATFIHWDNEIFGSSGRGPGPGGSVQMYRGQGGSGGAGTGN